MVAGEIGSASTDLAQCIGRGYSSEAVATATGSGVRSGKISEVSYPSSPAQPLANYFRNEGDNLPDGSGVSEQRMSTSRVEK